MRITKIETAIHRDSRRGLLFLRIHTDTGIIGCGETWYTPEAVAGMIHGWMARRLLGENPLNIESHWRFLYERSTSFGSPGCEIRALSAVDLALWDILGQATEQPVWQLLGGMTRESIPTYNSSGGAGYGGKIAAGDKLDGWPGHGKVGNEGPLNDYWSVIHRPADYAKELLDEGYRGLKMWSLDFAAHKPGGTLYISQKDVDEGLRPIREIRDAVGMDIEVMVDGHGFFQLPAALRIGHALRELNVLWIEDCMRPDALGPMIDFRRQTGTPIAVSEMLNRITDYREVLNHNAADYVMIDPSWVGGISQTKRICDLASGYNVPVVIHDCTGPFNLLAGVQVGTAVSNIAWQESLRAHLRLVYPDLIDVVPEVREGCIAAPDRPGIGAAWKPELFASGSGSIQISKA